MFRKLLILVRLIRVVWAFGGVICGPITDVTPTHLTNHVLATLREADYTANKIIELNGESHDGHMMIT